MEILGDEMGVDEEFDNGFYCFCCGLDDYCWMICCENCEDWFYGECINMDKGIGEVFIEKFICLNCMKGNFVMLYKKLCSLGLCCKVVCLGKDMESVFCLDEYVQVWWERMLVKLLKVKSVFGFDDIMI